MRNLAFVGVQPQMLRRGRRFFMLLLLIGVLSLATVPIVVRADVEAGAFTSGFGAAFGYAQTVGPFAFTQAGSIGNGSGFAEASTPFSFAESGAFSSGPSAAFSMALGSPFGSNAFAQTASFFGGFAEAFAEAGP